MCLFTSYTKIIAVVLLFIFIFPLLSTLATVPAYASNGDSSRGFMSLIKGLLMLFFFSFLSNREENPLDDSHRSAVNFDDEEFNYQRIDVTESERDILARAVYSEARGEIFEGQVAVAATVINRVESSEFPNDIESVVFQRTGGSYAFSAVLDGQIYLDPNETAYRAVEYALGGWDPSEGALYYYNPVTATSAWIFENTVPKIGSNGQELYIGNHLFAELK